MLAVGLLDSTYGLLEYALLVKRLRSALRMGGCEIKEVSVTSEFNHYVTMDIKLWVPAKDYKQAQKLLKELAEQNNVKCG